MNGVLPDRVAAAEDRVRSYRVLTNECFGRAGSRPLRLRSYTVDRIIAACPDTEPIGLNS